MPEQPVLLPFRKGSRRKRIKVGTATYTAGNPVSPAVQLNRVGMLAALAINFRGTVTLSGAGALADLGPWNLVNRFQLSVNTGPIDIWKLSGYETFIESSRIERGFLANSAGAGNTTPHADQYAAPVASGANTWSLWWYIPVSANLGKQFEVGLLNLQAEQVTATLEIVCGALLDPATLVTATTGTFHIYQYYWDVPPLDRVELPPLYVVRTVSEIFPISATGDQIYTIPRGGTLLQLGQIVRLNGSRSESVDQFLIQINKGDRPEIIERQWMRLINRIEMGVDLPNGVWYHDFFHAEEQVTEGDSRDVWNTELYTALDFITTITSGATLGSGNNFAHYIRRIVQPLEVR